ncbi:MAG: hypothetical protein AB7S26_16715 [Sandaracinaceae bacterium]
MRRVAIGLGSVLMMGGCVQLVAFDQPIVGQPDVVPGEEAQVGGELCDPEVSMGESVLCAESCEIDPSRGETSCSAERVSFADGHARVALSAMHEVELTLTACASDRPHVSLAGANGSHVDLDGRALTVFAAREADAEPVRVDAFLPEVGCIERTLVFQTGRIALEDLGSRLCSDHLLPVDDHWDVELSPSGLRSVELCLRAD